MVKKINRFKLLCGIAAGTLSVVSNVCANEIDTNIAQMQAMDKITGKVSVIEVPVNGNVNFGSFSILVRACKTRPPEDTPENFAFVDVVDNYNSKTPVNIFRGWMISSSPALNPVEHPIYDVWLLKCINGNVKPSQLLSKEELAARDALPKAPAFSDEAKLKNKDTLDDNRDEEKISIPTSENVENSETVPEHQKAEPVAEEKMLQDHLISNPPSLEAELNVDSTEPQVDGAPKSLLNIGQDSEPQADNIETSTDDKIVQEESSVLSTETASVAPEDKKSDSEDSNFIDKFMDDDPEKVSTKDVSESVETEVEPETEPMLREIDEEEIDNELKLFQ